MTVEEIEKSLEQIEKTLEILRTRNRTLYKLVWLFKYFNHPQWVLEVGELNKAGKPPKRRYPIDKIMKMTRCSERTAYDYSMTMDALECCLTLSSDSMFLLVYALIQPKKD